jgi:hypothetical protein
MVGGVYDEEFGARERGVRGDGKGRRACAGLALVGGAAVEIGLADDLGGGLIESVRGPLAGGGVEEQPVVDAVGDADLIADGKESADAGAELEGADGGGLGSVGIDSEDLRRELAGGEGRAVNQNPASLGGSGLRDEEAAAGIESDAGCRARCRYRW